MENKSSKKNILKNYVICYIQKNKKLRNEKGMTLKNITKNKFRKKPSWELFNSTFNFN
jgi:hypothetical protein